MYSIKNKIQSAVNDLSLNLENKIVLTEAATGAYAVTPIIAALAGAKVFAYTRDTLYGTKEEVKIQTNKIASLFSKNLDITIVDSITKEIINQADIITNSGHLRPLDKNILQFVKKEATICYMYEAWEIRHNDVDLKYCKENAIQVVATNEKHPDIDVFNYLGELSVRMLHDAGKCVYRNKFIIISNNDFGAFIAKTLNNMGAKVGVIDIPKNKGKYDKNVEWIGEFEKFKIPSEYEDTEAIIFTGYPFDFKWMQEHCIINTNEIKESVKNPFILRFDGDVDTLNLEKLGIQYFPKNVKSGHMGMLLSDIGYDSIIRLQAGGLKTGELGIKNEQNYNGIKILDRIS